MKDKVSQVCDYILDRLESGEYRIGEQIPSARKIEQEVDASFAMVQHAVNTLAQAGVLQSINRKGSVVRENWQSSLLPNHLLYYDPMREWVPGLQKLVETGLPDFRFCSAFERGMFELRTTTDIQQNKADYLDLYPYFRQLYGDGSEFFETPFQGFVDSKGALPGIPFIFSPRVIIYNPKVLRKYHCPEPHPNWQWHEFLATVQELRKHLISDRVLNFYPEPFFWINFVFRCGGLILETGSADPVKIDSPETCAGVAAVRELYRILGPMHYEDGFLQTFIADQSAMLLTDRQSLCFFKHHNYDGWKAVPLPQMPGGNTKTSQATELLCVRRECVDPEMITRFISFMLSEQVQNYIADEKYGIPIRKSAAMRSISAEDPRDCLFRQEMANMSAKYNMDSPELMKLVKNGIAMIIADPNKPLEESLRKLADAVRIFLEIQASESLNNQYKI